MQLKALFTNWTKVAGLLLMAGALAWTIKLGVIISTDGRIIDTGAAAFLMKAGILLLAVGSTGIGHRLSLHRPVWVRVIAIILSPVIVFGLFLLFAKIISPFIVTPLLENTSAWYAQQEAPIGLAVFFYLILGFLLYRSYRSVAR
ncbi:hypothetical protein [Rufibacter latericius]|uniref:Uncharacterized protein n=1 Tax=Rufibacter latericius TaxID=2487040 RepID=A0A3M9MT76_9BACT|nr:hypothetical protein [Rufibacter latericius]RNI28712.1 hypothetical protein EFB08_08750 [Rufibacter latericius]